MCSVSVHVTLKELISRLVVSSSEFVDDAGDDSKDEEEGGEDTEGDDEATDLGSGGGDVVELGGEGVLVGDERLLKVVEWEGNTVEWVKVLEWSWYELWWGLHLLAYLVSDGKGPQVFLFDFYHNNNHLNE